MKVSRYRLVVVWLAFLLGVLNYLKRTAIAFFAEPIMSSFDMTHTGFGAIASAFGVGYLLFPFIGGWMVDAIGTRNCLQ